MFELINQATQSWGDSFAGPDPSVPTEQRPNQSLPGDHAEGSFGQLIGDFGRGLEQEGIMGLLDPMGMLDRQDAQRDLQSRFDVRSPEDLVCEPGGDPYASNQVSPEEFQRIARTYSDIRMGRTNMEFNTAGMTPEQAQAFRDGTMEDIGDIMQTESGRGLINDVAYAPRRSDGTQPTLTLESSGNPVGANVDSTDSTQRARRGDGVGVDSTLQYVPRQDAVVPGTTDAWWPIRSDVALYHEMVHAHHNLGGTRASGQVSGAGIPAVDSTVNNSEYQATGLGTYANAQYSENRYRSERRALAGRFGERAGDGGPTMVNRDNYRPNM